jgi:hypothetical protein
MHISEASWTQRKSIAMCVLLTCAGGCTDPSRHSSKARGVPVESNATIEVSSTGHDPWRTIEFKASQAVIEALNAGLTNPRTASDSYVHVPNIRAVIRAKDKEAHVRYFGCSLPVGFLVEFRSSNGELNMRDILGTYSIIGADSKVLECVDTLLEGVQSSAPIVGNPK